MKEKIRPSSNIIDSIGKNLVIDEIAAIIELIKILMMLMLKT